jgi:aspartate 1-decarboxylase
MRNMLKSKIHRATVTGADLSYEGSITVDPELMVAADILDHEMVHVFNINNGERFETYAIEGERGSGDMVLNGAAARLVAVGDKIIVISTVILDDEAARDFKPRLVWVDDDNKISRRSP